MQLYAYQVGGGLVSAQHALKQKDYHCLECHGKVRVRGGLQRQKHFYHIQPPLHCKLSNKSIEHLQTQLKIQSLFPNDDCLLEFNFPNLGRIADVVNHTNKTVFEVQCSYITADEVLERIEDYNSAGYQVVWVLHQKTFNHRKVTAAEEALKGHTHYFTNINRQGEGTIYDELHYIQHGFRKKRYGKFEVNLANMIEVDEINYMPVLPIREMHKRATKWKLHYQGDALETFMQIEEISKESPFYKLYMMEKECRNLTTVHRRNIGQTLRRGYRRFLRHPVKVVFNLLLEESCRKR